jgi:hypothetical protein
MSIKRSILYFMLVIGLVLDVLGIIYYIMLYNRQVNNVVDSTIIQQYQHDHIFAQIYTMYGIALTTISIILLF